MDDLRIIELFFRRDEQAIRETAAKYGRLCYSIAYSILSSREDSEECVSDTYLGAWNTIPPSKPENLTVYLCRIVRNQSLKRLEYLTRDKRSHAVLVSLDELEEILPDNRYPADLNEQYVGRIISDFLHGQKELTRNVFIRKYYFFDSIGEIAERYSLTESSVKTTLYRVREELRDVLKKEGINV